MSRAGRRTVGWLAAAGLVVSGLAVAPTAVSAAATPSGTRAYEMVSPSDKGGGGIVPESRRTRAAADGDALGFISLTAFGDAVGTGVATDYVSVRSSGGWATHAITPRQESNTFTGVASVLEPYYPGEFSPDLTRGIFSARSPVTGDPNVARVANLYRRTDLRTPGAGVYDLVTACPLCDLIARPLPPLPGSTAAFRLRPELAGSSPDLQHVIFESQQRLTIDTPSVDESPRLYEWDAGEVRLAGRIPTLPAIACSDLNGPACGSSPVSVAGPGRPEWLSPHTVSDGSDGHRRVFFLTPTDALGVPDVDATSGNLFMRSDGTATVQLNASERSGRPHDAFAPASYNDAAADGSHVLFMTTQALTDDAPVDSDRKLYLYDTSLPASDPGNLTFLNPDVDDRDGADVVGAIGLGGDDPYVYFMTSGQLLDGEPLMRSEQRAIYVWHAGTLSRVAKFDRATESYKELLTTGNDQIAFPREARVTPDGRNLLFSTIEGSELLGYDHGRCFSGLLGTGCRELYVYSADSRALACVSCNPNGQAATANATTIVREFQSGTRQGEHETTALAPDGSRVFFSSSEALVPQDTNNRVDAYEYDVQARAVHLLSSGTDPSDSWFLDAGRDGRDVFFITRERLVGWDRDNLYDVYDARIGGGFPEPPPAALPCTGEACQGLPSVPPAASLPATSVFQGAGNVRERPKARPRASRRRCRRGFVKKRVRGKSMCVRRGTKSARGKRARTERRGS